MRGLNYWQLLAGITLFIFAMSLMADSLKNLSGRAFKKFLRNQTSNRLRALLGGTVVSAALQSSSLVLLMILSFVGAGIMTMKNALAVVLGSNLGTTLNSWIIATVGFKMELDILAYPLLAICLIGLLVFPKNLNIRNLTNFLISVSFLFIGLEWMKISTNHLQQNFDLKQFAEYAPYWFIIIGFVTTIILQFSSATFAITLTAVQGGAISIPSAACMIIGAELGTTVKILISSVAGIPDQKRVAIANFIFNLVTLVVSSLLLYPLLSLIRNVLGISDPFMALAGFQTMLNLMSIILFFPWLGRFAAWMERLFNGPAANSKLEYIRRSKEFFPENALGLAREETFHLLKQSISFNRLSLGMDGAEEIKTSRVKKFLKRIFRPVSIIETYDSLKALHGEILDYLVDLTKEEIAPDDFEKADELITASRYIMLSAKSMKDIRHNVEELRTSASDELFELFNAIKTREKKFYDALNLHLNKSSVPSTNKEEINGLMAENKTGHESDAEHILQLLTDNKISQLNASTMLNVHREIYSSHKAILIALEGLENHKK